MESAASAIETRMSSSQGIGRMSETTTSYETAIAAGTAVDSNVESRTTRLALDTDAGKPVFIKTIEGCSVERKYATSKFRITIIFLLIDKPRHTKVALHDR